jgi:hypothetical protein
VIHEWTYEAMAYDLLNLTSSTFKYEAEMAGGKVEMKEHILDERDELWVSHRDMDTMTYIGSSRTGETWKLYTSKAHAGLERAYIVFYARQSQFVFDSLRLSSRVGLTQEELRHLHFAEATKRLTNMMDDFRKKHAAASYGGGAGKSDSMDMRGMRNLVQSLPQYRCILLPVTL